MLRESTWNQKSTEYCEPAILLFNKRDISIQKIKRNFWKITDGGPRHVHFVEFMTILVVHTDSSTFKLYLITQYIKVGCTELEEFWLPTWQLTFESWSPAR